MNTDSDLLRRYIQTRDESAFTNLVQRHLGLVYSVALRRVGGDVQLAEDVAQKVFSDLARKASSLLARPTLSGWLYTSAHLASAAVVRAERRRKTRESEAHLMQTTLSSSSEPDADWARLRPVIDDVIVALKDEDREAIALRFFEKRSFAEVGAALRTTEEAARKRVDRALEKLRATLAQRGVTSTTAALGLTLTTLASSPTPIGLGPKVAGHAFAGASAPAGGSVFGTIASATLPAAAILVLGGILVSSQRQTNSVLRAELAQLAAENKRIVALRAENRQLARSIAQIAETSRAQAAPAHPAASNIVAMPPEARPISARINVTEDGRIMWNREPVSLRDFIARLRALPGTAAPDSRVSIMAVGTSFSALAYVIDEVRKAQLDHVTVESNVTPDPKFGWSWF